MNVLLTCHTLGFGGVERHILLLAEGLEALGHRVVAAVQPDSWLAQQLSGRGIAWERVRYRGLGDPLSYGRLLRIARRYDVQVINGHTRRSALYGALTSRVLRLGSVGTVHSLNTWKQYGLNDRMIAVSRSVREYLITKGLPADRIDVVHGGVPAPSPAVTDAREETRRELGIEADQLAVAMASRMVFYKGHDYFIDALGMIRERHPRVHGYILGGDTGAYAESLKDRAARLGLSDRVHFLGYRDDVARVLAAMDIFALPSHTEGLGLALLEAISVGLPAIAARVGGVPEILEHGVNGLLVPRTDPEALAAGLEALVDDPTLRAALGRRARATFDERFSAKVMARNTTLVYDSVTRKRRHSALSGEA